MALLLVLAVLALPTPAHGRRPAHGDTVRVALTATDRPGPFAFAHVLVGRGTRFPDVPEEVPTDFPDGFVPADTFHFDLQDEVALVQSVRHGFTDDRAFRTTMARWGLDEAAWTPLLTASADQAALVVVGRNGDGLRVALVDTDNDESLGDETAIPFPEFGSDEDAEAYVATLPASTVRYDRVSPGSGRVAEALTAVRLNVYPPPGRGPARPGRSVPLRVVPSQHRAGMVLVEDRPYRVAAGSTTRLGTSFFPGTAGFVFGTDSLESPSGPSPAYRLGDDVVLGSGAYRIASVDASGEALVLVRQGPAAAAVAPRPGALAPPMSGLTTDGAAFDLSDLRGRYVVLDFWGTWCTPCIEALPGLKALHAEASRSGVAFVGVADDEADTVSTFVGEHGVTWPQLAGDTSDRIAERYGITTYPSLLVVGPDGRVIFRASGSAARPDRVREALAAAIGPSADL